LINLASLVMAVVFAIVGWSWFESLVGKSISGSITSGGVTPWLIAIVVFVTGVVISGVYPALALSSFNPALVLKGSFLSHHRVCGCEN